MKSENFEETKGELREYEKDGKEFLSFITPKLPVEISPDNEMMMLLDNARGNLGQLYLISERLDNHPIYYRPTLALEALSSSIIEGTRTNMESLFEQELEDDNESKELELDSLLIKDLERAIEEGKEEIKNGKRPDIEFLEESHSRIMTRSQINDGKLKTEFNWIGRPSENLSTASFVPSPPNETEKLLENLFNYINNPDEDDLPALIKIAIFHYHFEAIHPFEDGNGRLGRLLINLQFCDPKITKNSQPLIPDLFLNISRYFLRNREKYYDSLMRVSQEGDYNQWIKFFLKGVIEETEVALERLKKIDNLRDTYKDEIRNSSAPDRGTEVVDMLFQNPMITIPKVQDEVDLSYHYANRIVHSLEDLGIIEEKQPSSSPKKFVAREIIKILYSDLEIEYDESRQ
jgi:Fic family protein